MNEIQLGQMTLEEAIDSGAIKLKGDKAVVTNFFAMLDNFEYWFNIVTP
jgi:alkyl sulfatase BDS1-like metallo-beta-lactamase superfamily hydrolase